MVDLLGSIQDGCKRMSSKVIAGRLRGYLIASGLSLALLSDLPLGRLTPKLGRVVILSRFGLVYGPNTVRSAW